MNFIDKTKPPPAGVWLLVRAFDDVGWNHYCVKAGSPWKLVLDSPVKWCVDYCIAFKIHNRDKKFIELYRFCPDFKGKHGMIIHADDAEHLENIFETRKDWIVPKYLYGSIHINLPDNFWKRNKGFGNRGRDYHLGEDL